MEVLHPILVADLDLALRPWANRTITAPAVERAHASLISWHRTWFCLDGDHVWLRPSSTCSGRHAIGCGTCSMGAERILSYLHALRTYLHAYPSARHAMCAVIGCRDGPSVNMPEGGRQRLAPPSPVLSYTGSPFSLDVPFPDYGVWRVPGVRPGWRALSHELEKAADRFPWESKKAQAVLAFGTRPSRFFIDPRPKHQEQPLRHALYHGRCDRHPSGQIAVFHGPDDPGRWLNKTDFCRYRVILMTYANAFWSDHMRDALLCGSLVIYVTDVAPMIQMRTHVAPKADQHAFDVLSRHLEPGVHYMLVSANSTADDANLDARRSLCERVATAVAWALEHDEEARSMAQRGRRLVRDLYRWPQILAYVHGLFTRMSTMQGSSVVRRVASHLGGVSVALKETSDSCLRVLSTGLTGANTSQRLAQLNECGIFVALASPPPPSRRFWDWLAAGG